MSTNEWSDIHKDVTVLMSTDKYALTLTVTMIDKSHVGRKAERTMPFQQLPLEQGEIVLEDYLCSIFEQLYQTIKKLREERTLS